GVRNVASNHAMVVMPPVIRVRLAYTKASLPVNDTPFSPIVTAAAAIIAEISLHALMRDQYQRRMYTEPVPNPTPSTNSHPEPMDFSCAAVYPLASTSR